MKGDTSVLLGVKGLILLFPIYHLSKISSLSTLLLFQQLCNAQIFEAPSGVGGKSLTRLKCRDKPSPSGRPQSHEDSHEVLVLPSVHPSAHARPVFLNKFSKPQYKIHVDHSAESAESNEVRYQRRLCI